MMLSHVHILTHVNTTISIWVISGSFMVENNFNGG